jgi:hypothetical protein
VLLETEDGVGGGGVVDEKDDVGLSYLWAGIGASVEELGEDVFGVGAHVGREYYFFVNCWHFCWHVGDDGADEGGLAHSFLMGEEVQSPTTARRIVLLFIQVDIS